MHRSTFLPIQPAAILIFSVDSGLGVGLTWATEVRIAGFLVGGVIDGFLGLVAVGAGIGKQK